MKRRSKKRAAKAHVAKATYGVYAKNYPRSVSWKVDFDYLNSLSPSEKEWLADFADAHYGGDFRPKGGRSENKAAWSREERREAFKDKNRSNRDLYVFTDVGGRLERFGLQRSGRCTSPDDFVARDQDPARGPAYLNTTAYRTAVTEYRKALDEGTDPSAARAALERIRKYGEAFPDEAVPDAGTDLDRELGAFHDPA